MNWFKENILVYLFVAIWYILLFADRISIRVGRLIGRKYHRNGKDWYVRIK